MGKIVTVTAPPPPAIAAPVAPPAAAAATSHFGSTISKIGDYFSALGRGAKRSVTNFAKGVANHISNSFHDLVDDPLGTFVKVINPIHNYHLVRDAVVGMGTWVGESAAKLYLPLSAGDGEGFVEAVGEVGTDLLIAEFLGRVQRRLGGGVPREGTVREEPGSTGGQGVTGAALRAARAEFNELKPEFWKAEAAGGKAGTYSAENLARMRAGKAPIGPDGYPMELHHRTPLAERGTNTFDNLEPLSRTDHRLGSNYKKNHPGLP